MATFQSKYAMNTEQAMSAINNIVDSVTVFDVEDAIAADATVGDKITQAFGVDWDDVLTDIMLQETNGSINEENLFNFSDI